MSEQGETDRNIHLITEALKKKASLKQGVYRNTLEVFNRLKNIASGIADDLSARFEVIDKFVRIELIDVNDFEFHLRFSGDLLTFTMQSNVITFPEEHILGVNKYVQENPDRGFFGQIIIYNFMADTYLQARVEDPGYLVARLLVNMENHFFVEGTRQLSHSFPDVAQNQLNDGLLKNLIETSMLVAIQTDLVATPYQEIMVVTLGQKLANQAVGTGQKVGFQMNANSADRGS